MTNLTNRERIITSYLKAYQTFDVEKMVADFDENVVFENVSNGEVTLSLRGLSEFKDQAERAKGSFTTRTQTIRSYQHRDNESEIEVDYHAVLAIDPSDDFKQGDEINLRGMSIFTFVGNKIVKLTDVS